MKNSNGRGGRKNLSHTVVFVGMRFTRLTCEPMVPLSTGINRALQFSPTLRVSLVDKQQRDSQGSKGTSITREYTNRREL